MATRSRVLNIPITGDSKKFARALADSDRHAKKSEQALGRLGERGSHHLGRLAKAAGAAALAYVSITEAKDAVNVTTDLAKATIGLHKNLGLSVKAASEWAAVAKTRNIETKALNQGFGTFAKNADKATKGTEAQVDAFKRLGITQGEIKKLDFNSLLGEAADGLKNMEPGVKKTSTAMQLFGRGWQTIVPVLRDGSKGMQEQLDLANKYGATFGGKTLKSQQDLIAAQREAKFATLGLQIAFSTKLAPVLTTVINKVSGFVAEMRSGKGEGGKFADTLKDIWSEAKPIVTWFGRAAVNVGKFAGQHKDITKVAGTVAAVAWAFNKFKIGTAIKAVAAFTRAAIATPGHVRSALSGVRRIFTSVFTSAGSAGGTAGAEGVGSAIAKKKGFFSALGTKSGKLIGKGIVIGIVAGIIAFGPEIRDAVQKQIDKAIPDGIDLGPLHIPTPRFLDPNNPPFAAGGMIGSQAVPGMLSPGEVGVEPDGSAWRVPGARTAADTVPAMLRPGTAILTGSGQRMVRSGASVMEAVARQAPHFATGGLVGATEYGLGEPGTGTHGYRGDYLPGKMAYAELGQAGGIGNALGGLPYRHPLRIAYKGRAVIARKLDVGRGGGPIHGHRRAIDLWRDTAEALRFPGYGLVRVTGAGRGVPGGSSLRYTKVTPAPVTHPLLGNMLAPLVDDALMGGIAAGQEGIGRRGLLTDVLEGILPQSGDRATRERVDFGRMPSGSRSGPGGDAGPVGAAIAEARRLDRAHYPYVWGGGHVQPARATGGGYDCSGAVARVMQQAGFDFPTGVSGQYQSWGAPGPGRKVTVFATPGHTFMKLRGSFFGTSRTNKGGGPGWLGTSYSTSGFTARHPPGYQSGGVVPGLYEEEAPPAGLGVNFRRLFGLLGRDMLGTRRADMLTRMLSRHARGLGIGRLLRLQRFARQQIRRMARHGFTGPERIRTRRLQGGISILQDEMGRPIGRALGASDRAQERIGRAEARLPDELILQGIDPDSVQGLTAQRTLAEQSLGTLGTRRTALAKALRRAKRTGNRAAIHAAQGELNEVDDQMLGLRSSIVQLTDQMKHTDDLLQQQLDATKAHTDAVNALRDEQRQTRDLVRTQGPALTSVLIQAINGGIGGNAGLGRQMPSSTGLSGLSRA